MARRRKAKVHKNIAGGYKNIERRRRKADIMSSTLNMSPVRTNNPFVKSSPAQKSKKEMALSSQK